jgi:hypothetical protein
MDMTWLAQSQQQQQQEQEQQEQQQQEPHKGSDMIAEHHCQGGGVGRGLSQMLVISQI